MRAVTIGQSTTDRDRPHLDLDAPRPEPVAGQVLVAVRAAGVNRIDLLQANGAMPTAPGGLGILGVEFCGIVEQVSDDVSAWVAGDRVCGLTRGGAYAEFVCANQGDLMLVPDAWSDAEGAAFPEAAATAWYALFGCGAAGDHETVLVHGGASSVGLALAEIGRRRGIRIIASCSTVEKAEAALQAGAWRAVVHTDEAVAPAVARLTEGRGVDVIVDNIGGEGISENLSMLAFGGRLVSIGSEAGSDAIVPLRDLRRSRWTINGFSLSALPSEERRAVFQRLREAQEDARTENSTRPVLSGEFPLADFEKALAEQESRSRIGKVVLVP